MKSIAAGLMLVLVGVPLVVLPSGFLTVLAGPAAALGAAGIVAHSVPLVTAAATIAMIEYVAALSVAGGPPDFVTAMIFGTALFLVIELVDFMRRTHGAAIGPSVTATMIRYWLGIAGLGAGLVVVLIAGAASLRLAVPIAFHPAAAAVGALGAFIAGVGVLKLVTTPRDA